jgi:hypothetical protein
MEASNAHRPTHFAHVAHLPLPSRPLPSPMSLAFVAGAGAGPSPFAVDIDFLRPRLARSCAGIPTIALHRYIVLPKSHIVCLLKSNIMLSSQDIVLQYVCPTFGMIAANLMFAGKPHIILHKITFIHQFL